MLMSAVEIRAEINTYLEKVQDESFLKVVHSMLDTYVREQEKEIIGYRTDTHEVDAGDFITLEELQEEVEKW